MRRYLAFILAALLPVLSGCGGRTAGGAEVSPAYESVEPTVLAEETAAPGLSPLDLGLETGELAVDAAAAGDRIYVQTRIDGAASVTDRLYAVDPEGGDKTLLAALETAAGPEDYRAELGVTKLASSQGGLWYYQVNDYVNHAGALVHLDPEGNETGRYTISEQIYVNYMAALGDGSLVVCLDAVRVLGPDGSDRGTLDIDPVGFDSMATLADGTVAGMYEDYRTGGTCLACIGGDLTLTRRDLGATKMFAPVGGSGPDELWFWDVDVRSYADLTGEGVRRLSWTDAGFSASSIYKVFLLSGDRLLVAEKRDPAAYGTVESGIDLYVVPAGYTMNDGSRNVLTLGGTGIPAEVSRAVTAFNRASGAYFIQTEDYSAYDTAEDYGAGTQRFLYDLTAGDLPDIILGPTDDMARRGYLADLGAMLDADPDLDRGDYLENVLAAAETGGALYALPVRFTLDTAACRPALLGEDGLLTIEDVAAAAADHAGEIIFQTERTQGLSALLAPYLGDFTDSGFDDPAFRAILDIAAAMPERFPEYQSWEEGQAAEQSSLLLPVNGWTVYDLAFDPIEAYGTEYVLAGWPSPEGGAALIRYDMTFGVAADTACPEGCWAFLRTLLTAEGQRALTADGQGMSIRRDLLAEQAARAADMDGQMLDYYAQTYGATEADIQAAVDRAVEAVETASAAAPDDSWTVANIICQEAAGYFDGQASADDVVRAVQNRVGLYLAEQS